MNIPFPDEFFVSQSTGGMKEYMDTKVYPNNLRIYSTLYDHIWRIKIKGEVQKGSLKIKGELVYNYLLDNERFFIQKIENGEPASEWLHIDMNITMVD